MDRCRLCTTNDRDALAEQLAEEMWNSRRDRAIDPPWEEAGPYWHRAMRQFADATLKMLQRDHG
ncbi:hypothetical protein M2336_003616 [Sphingobium sp. B1D7B]|nr:hypothetical protein [Sphingobium sp. B1D7B]